MISRPQPTGFSFIARLILGVLLQPALFALLLFGPAGTLAWWRAWVLIVVVAATSVTSLVVIFPGNRGLLEERLRPPLQKGQPLADKIVVLMLLATFVATIWFIPEDVFRLHLMDPPGPLLAMAGLVVFLAGWWIITLALKTNAFAALVVKHQKERQQKVVDTGPYAIVRHPMYAGTALMLVGMPLWLESYAGALVAGVPIAVLAIRIMIEEQLLRRELPGYDRYIDRVRYRLIPGLW